MGLGVILGSYSNGGWGSSLGVGASGGRGHPWELAHLGLGGSFLGVSRSVGWGSSLGVSTSGAGGVILGG